MRERCYYPKENRYAQYGGRGITVCDEWKNDFQAFYDWAMANGYNDDLSIDRIDVNGNYEPSNCRWATLEEQANNKRTSHLITIGGETFTLSEWLAKVNLTRRAFYDRVKKGMSEEQAILTPKGGG
jgi:hypothetical protein